MKIYSSNINNSQGRGWGSPLASFWAESTNKRRKTWGRAMQVYSIVQLPSSLGPMHCPWTLHITIRSYVLSMCPMHHYWVLCVVFVCYVSSWDPMRHCMLSLCPTYLLHIIVGPYVSLLDPMFHHWILCVVIGSYVLSSGPTHHCWGS